MLGLNVRVPEFHDIAQFGVEPYAHGHILLFKISLCRSILGPKMLGLHEQYLAYVLQ